MTDHKFTDDDVIKAYELCFTPKGTNETCAKCPFHKIGLLCKTKRDRAAFALINRQKAEIDRFADIGKMYSEVRTEATKEFAERLIKKCDAPHWCVWMSEIEDLVKEMTEDKNESESA